MIGFGLEMGVEQPETTFIGAAGPKEAGLRQPRGSDAGDSRPAGMEPLGPGPLLKKDLNAGGRAGSDALRPDELLRRQPQKLACDDRGSEMGDDAGGVKSDMVEAALDGAPDADSRFHTRHIGAQERPAIDAQGFAKRQGAG